MGTVTFLLTAWLVLMVVYVSALAIAAGIAYGYDYCLAEYTTLSSSNVQLELKPRGYGPGLLVGRSGNIVDLMAEGKEYRPRSDKMKSAKKRFPQWLFKAYQANTTSSKKKEIDSKEAKKDELTNTAMTLKKADQKYIPFRYMNKYTLHRESSNYIRTTDKADTGEKETEMDDKKVELVLPPVISATRSTEKTEEDEEVTETHEEEADLKLMPYIYAKWFSKPHHTIRLTDDVNMSEEDSQMYENKTDRKLIPLIYAERFFQPSRTTLHQASSTATLTNILKKGENLTEIQEKADINLLPFIPERLSQLTDHRVSLSLDPTRTTKEAEIYKAVSEEYQEGTGIYGLKLSTNLASTAYVWKSPNPDITMTLSTNMPSSSVGMRWFLPQSTRYAWHPVTSDTFFYKTNKDDQRKTTWNPYYPEMKIRVFNRPSFEKSVELPAMRYWDTITRTLESSTSDNNIDYKKFMYF